MAWHNFVIRQMTMNKTLEVVSQKDIQAHLTWVFGRMKTFKYGSTTRAMSIYDTCNWPSWKLIVKQLVAKAQAKVAKAQEKKDIWTLIRVSDELFLWV
jgi:hypothetical protein